MIQPALSQDPPAVDPVQVRRIAIAIPAYNEAGAIGDVIRDSLAVLAEVASEYEVLVGNDGSQDRTGAIADELARAHPQVRVVHHARNQGVARTCWELYRMAQTDWVAFFPGDGQIPPGELRAMLGGLDRMDVVVGHRYPRRDPAHRLVTAWLWNAAGRFLFGLNVRDMDSVKLYPMSLIRSIEIESASPFMETEILIKAARLGLRVGNVNVAHRPRRAGRQTGLRPRVVAGALAELLRYWWAHR